MKKSLKQLCLALVAGLPSDELDRYLGGPLARTTTRSLIEPAGLRRRLRTLQRDGFAWGLGEFDEAINSVAAPLTNRRGTTVAALHIHGPAFRFPIEGQADEIGRLVRDTADRLGRRLT